MKISHIPPKLNKELNEDTQYTLCFMYGWHGHLCDGRISRDHSMKFNGESVQRKWAINPVCIFGHGIEGFKDNAVKKEVREWIALCRATDADFLELTKETELSSLSKAAAFVQRKKYLCSKYGVWTLKVPEAGQLIMDMHPAPNTSKRNWYLVTQHDTDMIERMRAFYKTIGTDFLPREMVAFAIENEYLQIKDRLLQEDPELYKKIGFDKQLS